MWFKPKEYGEYLGIGTITVLEWVKPLNHTFELGAKKKAQKAIQDTVEEAKIE